MPRKVTNGIDLVNNRGVNFADPSSPTDAATKQYVDNLVGGVEYKDEVRVATTTNGTLATAYVAGQVIDGYTLVLNDRILIKNQTTGFENGIRIVQSSGAPVRSSDANTTAKLNNATVYVTNGSTQKNTEWTQTATDPVVDTTALVFAQKSVGQSATSGSGAISVTSGAVSFVPKSGGNLAQDAGGAYVDQTTITGLKRYVTDVPAAAAGATITLTHNLGSTDRVGEPLCYVKATGEVVDADIVLGTTSDTLVFGAAVTAAQYRYSTGL